MAHATQCASEPSPCAAFLTSALPVACALPLAGSWALSSTASAPRWRSRPCSSASCTALRKSWRRRTARMQRQTLQQMLLPAHARWAGRTGGGCVGVFAALLHPARSSCRGMLTMALPRPCCCCCRLAGQAPVAARLPVLLSARLRGAAAGAATLPRMCGAQWPLCGLWNRQVVGMHALLTRHGCDVSGSLTCCSCAWHAGRVLIAWAPAVCHSSGLLAAAPEAGGSRAAAVYSQRCTSCQRCIPAAPTLASALLVPSSCGEPGWQPPLRWASQQPAARQQCRGGGLPAGRERRPVRAAGAAGL